MSNNKKRDGTGSLDGAPPALVTISSVNIGTGATASVKAGRNRPSSVPNAMGARFVSQSTQERCNVSNPPRPRSFALLQHVSRIHRAPSAPSRTMTLFTWAGIDGVEPIPRADDLDEPARRASWSGIVSGRSAEKRRGAFRLLRIFIRFRRRFRHVTPAARLRDQGRYRDLGNLGQ